MWCFLLPLHSKYQPFGELFLHQSFLSASRLLAAGQHSAKVSWQLSLAQCENQAYTHVPTLS